MEERPQLFLAWSMFTVGAVWGFVLARWGMVALLEVFGGTVVVLWFFRELPLWLIRRAERKHSP